MAGRVAFALAAAAMLAGVPASHAAPASEIVGIDDLGSGADEVWIVRPGAVRSIVVFLHERGDPIPQRYLGWLDHLAAEESAVVFPRYESGGARTPQQALRALRRAVAAAERHLATLPATAFGGGPVRGVPVIVVGYSYGASLAFYLAASSARWGMPAPKAVVSIFPRPGRLPGIPLPPLARTTRVLLQVGEDDGAAARAGAADLWRALARHPSAHKRLVTVRSTTGLKANHGAPLRTTSAAVAAFWAPLDDVVFEARGG